MSTVVCNARGLGGNRAFLLLRQLVADLKPLILFICESKIHCNRAYKWLSALNFYGVVGANPIGTKGGLLLFWNKNVDVSLHSFFSNHIDDSINWESLHWRFTGCYAPAKPEERVAFWDLLIKLWKLRQADDEPWVIRETSMKFSLILRKLEVEKDLAADF